MLSYRLYLEDELRKFEEEKEELLALLGTVVVQREEDIQKKLDETMVKLSVLRQEIQKLDQA